MNALSNEPAKRKSAPMAEGLLYYFPNALAAVATVSRAGNDQHHPGKPLHHDRSKSTDHADCIIRHLVDAGALDTDGVRHSAKVAWRALALLQEEIERDEGAPLPRNARMVSKAKELFLVAESAYLASFGPNANVDVSPTGHNAHPMQAEADRIASWERENGRGI